METSIEKYIAEKSAQSNIPALIETYLTNLLLIHDEIQSPIEKLFFIEWHFQKMFLPNDEYNLIPQYQDHETTGNYIVDFMVIGYCNHPLIAIEIDGHEFHEKTKEQVRNDKKRERFITKNIMKFLRFSGSEIYENPTKVVNEILRLIEKMKEERDE